MSEERITKYSIHSMEGIKARLAAGEDNTDWERIENMSEKEIERLAREDAEEHGYDLDWYKRAVPVLPADAAPEGVDKRRISIRLDEDIIEFFQQAGRGYQTRINDALRIVMNKMTGQESRPKP